MVLTLLAAGRSSTEIGQALFISNKTASVHVSNILAKLGVSGRVEAAAVAHRPGVYGPAARKGRMAKQPSRGSKAYRKPG